MSEVLSIGHSPDPDDAFMFCALSNGAVKIRDYEIDHVLQDIQTLNERAMKGELAVTAISAHAFLSVADKYWIMATGASMGEPSAPKAAPWPPIASNSSLSPPMSPPPVPTPVASHTVRKKTTAASSHMRTRAITS